MNKTVYIEGMGCSHCEARVKSALEALPQVISAQVSKDSGTAVVELREAVADSLLKETAACGIPLRGHTRKADWFAMTI